MSCCVCSQVQHQRQERDLVFVFINEWLSSSQVQRQRQERDLELKEITAQLLFFEGQLKKEQGDIKTMLKEKELTIRGQLRKIKELEGTNKCLHRELSDIKKSLPNGLHVSFCDDQHKNGRLSPESSIIDDVFMQIPHTGTDTDGNKHRKSSNNKTSNNRKKNKSRNSSPFYRSISLPNCIDSADLVAADNAIESTGSTQSVNRKRDNISDNNSNDISNSDLSRVRGRRERTSSGNNRDIITNNNNDLNKYHHMAYSQPNLNSSSASNNSLQSSKSDIDTSMDTSETSNLSQAISVSCHVDTSVTSSETSNLSQTRSVSCHVDTSVTSSETSNLSQARSVSCHVVNVTEKKSESPRDRIKRAFLRPRDVKKKSKMRSRSNSLKENDPDVKNKLSQTKRYFSFAF